MAGNLATNHVENLVEPDVSMPYQIGMPGLRPSATTERGVGVAIQEGLAGFTPVSQADPSGRDMDQPEDPTEDLHLGEQELEWWDLTFAEAGFAHFDGLEPVWGGGTYKHF